MTTTNTVSSRVLVTCMVALGLLTAAGASAGPRNAGEAGQRAAVKGRVFSGPEPVAAAKVYAYEVATYAMRKVKTDRHGHFLFASLPAGMYKIIAFKEGFVPTVEPLLRHKPQLHQFVEIRLRQEAVGDVREAEDYWTVRSRVPPDVLRDIQGLARLGETAAFAGARLSADSRFGGQMLLHSGVESLGSAYGNTRLTTAEVDLDGKIGDTTVGLNGAHQRLTPDETGTLPDGQVQTVDVGLASPQISNLSVSSTTAQLPTQSGSGMLPVDLERYQLRWNGQTGSRGRSGFSAQYLQESNFYRVGWLDPAAVPGSSRTWDVQGFYTGEIDERTSLQAGVRYRQREGEPLAGSGLEDGEETLGLYGLAGSQIQRGVVVEYGLFSSVRDGGWSLMPHGGVVVQLGKDWRARTAFSRRLEDRPEELLPGFSTAFYNDTMTCQEAGEACYEVTFARGDGEEIDSFSVGAVHREFAETLRLYFSHDFFTRLESLFVVEGDAVPELQFSMVRRIAPRVLAKLESNIASGGGGIFYATDDQSYENEVRYLVTSLDTRFQTTSTGVFVAFHHLEQALNPLDRTAETASEIEMQRLQLMLTQDLNVLADAASNWAVRLNVELSRGATPYTLTTDDELHKKLTGGISVSF